VESGVFRPEPGIRIIARDLRGLTSVDWRLTPGVSLLVGPNGAGKSTLLAAVAWLKEAFTRSPNDAIQSHLLGATDLVRHDSAANAFTVGLGDGTWTWRLSVVPRGGGIEGLCAESIEQDLPVPDTAEPSFREGPGLPLPIPTVVLDRAAGSRDIDFRGKTVDGDGSCALRTVTDRIPDHPFGSLVSLLASSRMFPRYGTDGFERGWLRKNGSQAHAGVELEDDGRNVFSVLRNWRDKHKTRDRTDWVESMLRTAFPKQFDGLEFETTSQTVSGLFVAPGSRRSIPWYLAADGMLQMLLWLTALAGAPEGGLLLLDELETALHPHAIAVLLEACRDMAERRNLTIVAATHSPVLLNLFHEEPERVFILDPAQGDRQPIAASELHARDWLSLFALGDLYQQGRLGRQDLPG
jgi:predicted ATPase